MIIVDCEQQTEDWYKIKAGIPSSSCFSKIITTKGAPSTSCKAYMYQMAGEKIIGRTESGYQSEAMLYGTKMEDKAREVYEFITGNNVKQIGFCLDDQKRYGASTDGLIGDDGMIEIKCPYLHTHVKYLLDNKLPTEYFQQVQGGMFVTERKWCNFVSYFPEMPILILRVERDEEFILKLENELIKFNKELQTVIEKLKW